MAVVWGTLSQSGVRVNDYTVTISEITQGHRITVSRRGYDDQSIDIPDTGMQMAMELALAAATGASQAAERADAAAAAHSISVVDGTLVFADVSNE